MNELISPFYFRPISEEATRYSKVILTDGTANEEFTVANIVIGYYNQSTGNWKDKDGVDVTFPVLFWSPTPQVPQLSMRP